MFHPVLGGGLAASAQNWVEGYSDANLLSEEFYGRFRYFFIERSIAVNQVGARISLPYIGFLALHQTVHFFCQM